MKKDESFWMNLYDGVRDVCSEPLILIITISSFWFLISLIIITICIHPIFIPIFLIFIVLLVGVYKFIKFMAEAEDIDG